MAFCVRVGCTGLVGTVRLFKHFSGFEFFLLPSRIHARPHAATIPLASLENDVTYHWAGSAICEPVSFHKQQSM